MRDRTVLPVTQMIWVIHAFTHSITALWPDSFLVPGRVGGWVGFGAQYGTVQSRDINCRFWTTFGSGPKPAVYHYCAVPCRAGCGCSPEQINMHTHIYNWHRPTLLNSTGGVNWLQLTACVRCRGSASRSRRVFCRACRSWRAVLSHSTRYSACRRDPGSSDSATSLPPSSRNNTSTHTHTHTHTYFH